MLFIDMNAAWLFWSDWEPPEPGPPTFTASFPIDIFNKDSKHTTLPMYLFQIHVMHSVDT